MMWIINRKQTTSVSKHLIRSAAYKRDVKMKLRLVSLNFPQAQVLGSDATDNGVMPYARRCSFAVELSVIEIAH